MILETLMDLADLGDVVATVALPQSVPACRTRSSAVGEGIPVHWNALRPSGRRSHGGGDVESGLVGSELGGWRC
jgi:hypothetical protein